MSMMAAVRQENQAAHKTSMEHTAEPYMARNCAMQQCYLSVLARTVHDRVETKVQTAQQLW